jgi:hypothetical protein
MAKKDRQIMQQLNHAARLARTALATKLLEQNLYAGQDQLMLALAQMPGRRISSSQKQAKRQSSASKRLSGKQKSVRLKISTRRTARRWPNC